jgi:hypothetical protein
MNETHFLKEAVVGYWEITSVAYKVNLSEPLKVPQIKTQAAWNGRAFSRPVTQD